MTNDGLPEPAQPYVWMTSESRMRLAREGGNCKGAVPVHPKRSPTATHPLYTADQLRAAIAQERARCARLCDEQVKALSDEGESRCAMVAGMCAAAIRGQAEGERG